MTSYSTNTDWEKRMKYTTIACPMCGVSLDFIRQLLLTERKKWIKEIKKLMQKHPDYEKHIHTFTFENRGNCGICKMSWRKATHQEIYNKALSDAIRAIFEKKK